jgi:hypothetical protein
LLHFARSPLSLSCADGIASFDSSKRRAAEARYGMALRL